MWYWNEINIIALLHFKQKLAHVIKIIKTSESDILAMYFKTYTVFAGKVSEVCEKWTIGGFFLK